ncbi:MAG TPA: iron-sulfur cluster repair protein YtfE [Aquabacterium sp.]|nr:iron-sulfur cluster repair protein YtfE [Aquabacterium sp.]
MTLMQQALGQIAREIPGATGVFHAHKLDFCCGGAHTLAEATRKKGLDPQPIVAALETLQAQAGDVPGAWEGAPAAALIDHILTRYHERHGPQLDELIRLARRVEAVHREHPDCPTGLAALLNDIQDELASHMAKEENVLFPMLKAGQRERMQGPIFIMQDEHEAHGAELARVEALTQDMTPPVGACNTWQALYTGLRAFREDLMQHIHLENNVLFPGIGLAN